jgi:hypothetical protein
MSWTLVQSNRACSNGSTADVSSQVSGFPTGLAGSTTVTAQITTGAAPTTASNATVGAVFETSTPGTYQCLVTYTAANLSVGTIPVVHWSVNGALLDDANPIPTQPFASLVVESGVSFLQCISAIAAACSGVCSISGNTVAYAAIGNSQTPRISAQAANGTRSSVTLTLPSI